MREIVFRVCHGPADQFSAVADGYPLTIAAPTLEELQHEAREALIQHFGPAHVAYRVRLQRPSMARRPPLPARLRRRAVPAQGSA